MAKRITDPANRNYDFGHEFNYDVWTADTEISLVNVPWNNDYRDTVWFNSNAALDTYIDNLPGEHTINTTYAVLNQPVRLNLPFNRVFKYNYLRAHNPAQPIPGSDVPSTFYYFIVGVQRLAPNTTLIDLELDVWQTFIRNTTFGKSYVERGHVGIAASNAFQNYGRDFLTIPESIDQGAEMVTVHKATRTIAQNEHLNFSGGVLTQEKNYDALIVSTTKLRTAEPENEVVEPATGQGIQRMASGADVYVMPGDSLSGYLIEMKDYPWVLQGIVSITLIPKITRYNASFEYDPSGIPQYVSGPFLRRLQYSLVSDWRNNSQISNRIPARYRNLRKFYTFPYMAVELTCSTGTPVVLRPEAWNHPDLRIMERIALMPPNQRVAFFPRGYNSLRAPSEYESVYNATGTLPPELQPAADLFNQNDGDDYGDFQGVFTEITGFPQVPAVNDNAALAISSTRHGTAAARSSAQWAMQRTHAAANMGVEQAAQAARTEAEIQQRGFAGAARSQQITQDAQDRGAALNAVSGIASGLAGGLTGGLPGAAVGAASGIAGAVTGHIGLGIEQSASNAQLANSRQTEYRQGDLSRGLSTSLAKKNANLAKDSARGDYANTIASIDAQAQDLQMTPPSMMGQYGGETLNFVHDGLAVSARIKMVDASAVARIGEYWLRYGYAINRFTNLPTNLQCMTKFTYWKMQETYITSAPYPEFFKQAMRGILEKGVTVWSNPADIGNIDHADNQPLPGITL